MFRLLSRELDDMFGRFGFDRPFLSDTNVAWTPNVEMFAKGNEIVVRADVPGRKPLCAAILREPCPGLPCLACPACRACRARPPCLLCPPCPAFARIRSQASYGEARLSAFGAEAACSRIIPAVSQSGGS
jgi:hypothetical protein